MLRIKTHRKKPGLPPGSLVFTGDQRSAPVSISALTYTSERVRERRDIDPEACGEVAEEEGITWINVNGVHDTDRIASIGVLAGLHPLVLEDVLNTQQRPKYEAYDGYSFIVVKMLHVNETGEFDIEQVSLVVATNLVISFQEFAGDVFEPVRERIHSGKGNLRNAGADYLAYALVDTIVDHYFHVLERVADRMEEIETELLDDSRDDVMPRLMHLKRDVLHLRRAVWPMREVIGGMQRDDDRIFQKKTRLFLRDVYDHAVETIEILETLRDGLASLTDLYLSLQGQRMNEIMKVLTIVGTIFIPLTFIAGVYGMNFERMPELHWTYGYPLVMIGMLVVGLLLIVYFKRKDWI